MEAVHHVAISVRDIDRAVQFYTDVMGFEVDFDNDHRCGEPLGNVVGLKDVDVRIVMLKGYGLRVELFKYYNPAGRDLGPKRQCDFGLTHFAFSVKGIHSVYERLLNKGVEFNCPPQNLRPGVWATYFHDPEGNTMELVEYGAPE